MSETKEEKLKRLQEEYSALQQEVEQEKAASPTKERDTLYQLLYASILRHGVAEDAPSVMVIQVPAVAPSPKHNIIWGVAEDKKSMFIRIVNRQEELSAPGEPKGGITIGSKVDEEAEQARDEVMA